jgi:hypothetical protein
MQAPAEFRTFPTGPMRRRVVAPEWLETLSEQDPAAIQSRQELLQVNAFMGNHRWITQELQRHWQPGWRVTELGAGDGALSRHWLQQGLCPAEALHGVDLAPRPADWPGAAHWQQGDVFQHGLPGTEVLVANLILHHFTPADLTRLGSMISPHTRLILAAEPARIRSFCWLGRGLTWLAEMHPVTRYDMQVSLRAGFRRAELPESLGLGPQWQTDSWVTPLGAYRMRALFSFHG